MYGSSETPQQWAVHAELTISHPGITNTNVPVQTRTERDDNGLRMVYTWTSDANNPSQQPPLASSAGDARYGFQRGNMLFTSTPPKREATQPSRLSVNVQDSGYNSELLSPNSLTSGSCSRRPIQPYNRKCKSTCSIVLSTSFDPQNAQPLSTNHTQCGRTQSLRCQTPTSRPSDHKDAYYGCGDPWCYHASEFPRFSPVPESKEEGKRPLSRANTYAARDAKNSAKYVAPTFVFGRGSKDASVQTFEMVDKCTSPFLKMGSFYFNEEKNNSPASFTPDSLESLRSSRRVKRSPAKVQDKKDSASDSKSDPNKKPRTVHIDVYCTGTDPDSSSSSSDSENKTASSPQTVFESGKVRVTHARANESDLPFSLKGSLQNNRAKPAPKNQDESDDDGASTAYPSEISSYSAIRDFGSSVSSVPASWSSVSMSSCAVPDNDYDSIANTSWKDTVSDFDGLQSRSSIAQTDSLDFVPRKLFDPQKSESIKETPEPDVAKEVVATPSHSSVNPSDSFEYANSEDRLRIKKMETMWDKFENPKRWKSPQVERKHLLQQKRLQEYMEKRLSDKNLPKWESKDSDSGSDSSEKGWTFIKNDDKKLERDVTVRRASKDDFSVKKVPEAIKEEEKQLAAVPDIEPGNGNQVARSAACKTPSFIALKQRLTLDPTLRAPFTIVPGIYTDQRFIAKKFGTIVGAFKKPGHHVGPAKNPDCLCDHCKSYYESGGPRNRARSLGEAPIGLNWRNSLRTSQPKEIFLTAGRKDIL